MATKFAQHFLINQHAVERIVNAMKLAPQDTVLEIGPGKGAVTALLVEGVQRVVVVEIDPQMVALLKKKLIGSKNVAIIEKDILEFDLSALPEKEIKVVGNLPYNLTSPILRKLSEWTGWSTAFLMVQKEVGDRLCAPAGSSDYGALTVGMNLTCEIAPVFVLSESSFKPAPRVKSAVVKLTRRAVPLTDNIPAVQRVIQAAFQQRRKVILNSLSHGLGLPKEIVEATLENLKISPQIRPERIPVSQFIALAQQLV